MIGREPGTFTLVDKGAIQRMAMVGTVAFGVYCILADFCDSDRTCYPSAKTIAKLAGITRRSVFNAIKTLENAGWIKVERTREQNGTLHNHYTLLPLQPGESNDTRAVSFTRGGESNDTRVVNETTLEQEPKNKKARARFAPPSVAEVQAYCHERGNKVIPENFVDYYVANGWKVGRNPMKDWRATVRNWERNGIANGKPQASSNGAPKKDPYIFAASE